jgi:hypothetical protein
MGLEALDDVDVADDLRHRVQRDTFHFRAPHVCAMSIGGGCISADHGLLSLTSKSKNNPIPKLSRIR